MAYRRSLTNDSIAYRKRVVAIVGAGPGIGAAVAEVVVRAGWVAACVDISAEVARETADRADVSGASSSAHQADVLNRIEVRRAIVEIVAAHGMLSGVVNVVGRGHLAETAADTDEIWQSQLDINLTHHFIVAQEALAYLRPARGSYVAIASINGLRASPDLVAYGVAKAGLISLMQTLAIENASVVRFNSIAPGVVATAHANEVGFTSGDRGRRFLARIPAGEFARPSDIANTAEFLLSDRSGHITGQTIVVDGGTTVQYPLPRPLEP